MTVRELLEALSSFPDDLDVEISYEGDARMDVMGVCLRGGCAVAGRELGLRQGLPGAVVHVVPGQR